MLIDKVVIDLSPGSSVGMESTLVLGPGDRISFTDIRGGKILSPYAVTFRDCVFEGSSPYYGKTSGQPLNLSGAGEKPLLDRCIFKSVDFNLPTDCIFEGCRKEGK